MSDQRHDPYDNPYGQAPAAWPPAGGQDEQDYAGPDTQVGSVLREESAAAQQTAYLPPVTDGGGYGGGGYGGGTYDGSYAGSYGGSHEGSHGGSPGVSHQGSHGGGHAHSYGGGTPYAAGTPAPHQAASGDAAETAYLPPVTGGGDAEQTAYLPPVTDAGQAPQDAAHWPHGWESPAPGRRPFPGPGGPGGPGPGRPGGPGGPDTGTLYGAPTTRRPKPPADVLREERSSPLIAPGPQPALLTAGLAALLLVTAALDVRAGLAVAVALLQAVTAAGWFRLNGMWPARQGIALAAAAGLTATGAAVAAGRDDATAAALASFGAWALVILFVQLRATDSSQERLSALNATLTAAALTALAAGYLAAPPHAVIVGAAALAVGVLMRAVPLPPKVSPVAAVAAATLAGCLVGLATDLGAAGALLGLAAGASVLVAIHTASYDFPSRFVHLTAGVALPLTLGVPAVHVIGGWLA